MLLFKHLFIVIGTVASLCYSENVRRNRSGDTQKILEILAAQDEKINRLHTLVTANVYLKKCSSIIKSGDLSDRCWKEWSSEFKVYDQSATTEMKLFCQLVANAYDGEQSRIPNIMQFIKENVEKGSEMANTVYNSLIDEMNHHGQLYLKEVKGDNGLGSGLVDYTYRALFTINEAEGQMSPIFNEKLPKVVKSILNGDQVYIRNNATKDFMYASNDQSKVLANGGPAQNVDRYLWTLSPVEAEWTKNNRELFYIKNARSDDEILAVKDGYLVMADAVEKSDSTWAMFYIRLVQGVTGEEVAIQCSYWGIKTLALESGKPKLFSLNSLENHPSAIWVLHSKV